MIALSCCRTLRKIYYIYYSDKTTIETSALILTKHQVEIIRAVLYFDVFKYPLTRHELFENAAITISQAEFNEALDELLRNNFIKEDGEFILSPGRTQSDILKRTAGNKGAVEIMPTAYAYSRRIASFPFVEGVMLSGSLSKNYYDKTSDIDFFIVTRPGRLWICRTLLIIRYKLLPEHKKKYWCTNYFISSENLAIPDMNVFTGTELAYLIPTVNYQVYKKIVEENTWYKKRFPNKKEAAPGNCMDLPQTFLKSLAEKLLDNRLGSWLDNMLLEYTLKRWRKKYPDMNNEDFNLQFRSRKDVCKRHTHGFQNKILVLWEKKTVEFEQKFNASLDN